MLDKSKNYLARQVSVLADSKRSTDDGNTGSKATPTSTSTSSMTSEQTPCSANAQILREIVEAEIQALRRIPLSDGSIDDAVRCILHCVHRDSRDPHSPAEPAHNKRPRRTLRRGKVVVSGMGKAGHMGKNISAMFASTGTPSVFLHPSEAQHGDLGMIQGGDVLILLSNSGETKEVLDLVHLARSLHGNMSEASDESVPIIAITGKADGELIRLCDIAICTGMPEEVCPLGLAPTTSTTAMKVVGDMLVVSTMKAIGYTKGEYAKLHNSGYLGRKARQETAT